MRLKHIKLSGFKSFVDPTSVSFPANLVGVVGPNGCGKSNIIDAVRWVMGESSAKNLRGDSMADVIFNGSTARKPVGKAAVELVFDNSEGKAPGAYAGYSEIAIRRELSRDGQSLYYINKTRCRRRDITDIFLGTGLGPRSYSIIEQGMVSRIIEARPDELRVLVEEAAGISKYKERRRETETRIRHARENLERVGDIRRELESQLRRLKRQSSAAARYKTLKQEERTLRVQLMSLRWRRLDQQLKEQDSGLARRQTGLESKIADQRAVETGIEHLRQQLAGANEHLNQAQGEFYQVGAEIANKEQSIEHSRQTQQQRQQELQRLTEALEEAEIHMVADRERLAELQLKLGECRPRLTQANQEFDRAIGLLNASEQAFQHWQAEWDEFGRDSARPEHEREVQRARIEEHHRQIEHIAGRQGRMAENLTEIQLALEQTDTPGLRAQVVALDQLYTDLEQQVRELDQRIQSQRESMDNAEQELFEARHRFQETAARLKSLKEMQASALGTQEEDAVTWLQEQRIFDAPRLAAEITVEPGWETAVDCVLGRRLGALCVESLDQVAADAPSFPGSGLCMVENRNPRPNETPSKPPTLLTKVTCHRTDLNHWLGDVYVSPDIEAAIVRRGELAAHESIVTQDGVWMGLNWVVVARGEGAKAGLLVREKEIDHLSQREQQLAQEVRYLDANIEDQRERLTALEEELAAKRGLLSEKARHRAEMHKQLGHAEARAVELQARRDQIRGDLSELDQLLGQAEGELIEARTRLDNAQRLSEDFQARHVNLSAERSRLRQELDQANTAANSAREAKHREQYEEKRLLAALETVQESMQRMAHQQAAAIQRQQALRDLLNEDVSPEARLQDELNSLLEQKVQAETQLAQARREVERLDSEIRDREQQRVEHENEANLLREQVEELRLARQELAVRRDTVSDQIKETDHEPAAVLQELPEDAQEETWQEQLDRIGSRIDRIGPVNLVAIEEYEEQSERKVYLDKQNDDLTEALTMLQDVIHKIDRETRTRFKETFEALNAQFQEFFPRLFGGGSANLELTGADLLDTGVGVMARPPGKRNSTIHLLSGGEKALTAVALLFAFFDLNPAPFCMLDEVDAPLDDANVERYCKILKTLADRTQLIVITHNKITMEAANILIGITMAEPGVSRLVAVDVDAAMEMAVQ